MAAGFNTPLPFFVGAAGSDVTNPSVNSPFPFFIGVAGFTPPGVTATQERIRWLYKHERRYPAGDLTPGPVTAEFTWDATTNPPTVYFTNQSIGASSWMWDFGDGNFSNERDPENTYAFVEPIKEFTVSLTINGGQDTVIHVIEVINILAGPVLTLNTLTMAQMNTLTMAQLNTLPVA